LSYHKVHWTAQKILARLKLITPLIHRQRAPLAPFKLKVLPNPIDAPLIHDDASGWQTVAPGDFWATPLTDFMLRGEFTVPTDFDAGSPVALHLPIGDAKDFSHPEALTYIDGAPYASADKHHQEIRLPDRVRDGQPHQLALHGWSGRNDYGMLQMKECAVVQVDQPTRDFVASVRVALDVSRKMDDNSTAKGRILNALNEAFNVLDTRDPLGTDAFYDSVPPALEALNSGLKAAGDPMDVDIIGIGHAHIDVAWLWTLDQTVRKSGRTFSNVLRLMEDFPDYKFSQSQPQLYQYVEQYYPEIFEQIKARVAEGRWEPMGGTWVEPDCNCIGAESLARQFLLGRGYFRRHFGNVDTPVLWLPDTFGYSWALPQLIKLAGMKYFITHKMSWNQYNQMPYQFLWWQGLDGTRVLTHFLTTTEGNEYLPYSTTYNGMMNATEVFGTWENFRQKETHNELITAYGYGDGGGGPTREMIENLERFRDLAGTPRVRPGTLAEFMDRAEAEIADKLPVWNGEFYLEYHRGTYTSQAKNKRNNRKSEFLLHDAEFLAAWAALATDYVYPHDDLRKAWELVCLNQFHDILPGSSIEQVYVDSDRDYAIIRELGEKVREDAIAALAQTLPEDAALMVINPTSFNQSGIAFLEGQLDPSNGLATESGSVRTQAVTDGTLIDIAYGIEPYSVLALSTKAHDFSPPALMATRENDSTVLDNGGLRVEIDSNGDITRIYDRELDREVLAPREIGNQLLAFEDRPMQFDAWDIDIFYEDRTEKVAGVQSITITETGPLRAAVEIVRKYRSSTIRQTIYMYENSRRIDFDSHVDWHEQHILLKVAFPVDILSPVATFDVQWGNVQRATHRNTSWDWARFETCAHKWADLSESGYGVALLNDCKYGYDIHDNVIRLSLIKSATSPDRHADQGEHHFTYSLFPHRGDWREGGVVEAAYALNNPLIVRRVNGGMAKSRYPLVQVDSSHVVIETIKQAEDGNGLIVRLYESERRRGKVALDAGFDVAEARIVNLLEEDIEPVELESYGLTLDLKPYQIITLRLIPK
jgi:alpha-mannosidase